MRRWSHYEGSIRTDNRLSAPVGDRFMQLPLSVLYAGGGRGKGSARLYPHGRGACGDRGCGDSAGRPKDPTHRRGTAGAAGNSGYLPGAAGHPGTEGALPHHQRQPAAGIGKAPAGSRGRPPEYQSGHAEAGTVSGDHPAGRGAASRAL